MSDLWLGKIDLNNTKYVKNINKNLIPTAWHPSR